MMFRKWIHGWNGFGIALSLVGMSMIFGACGQESTKIAPEAETFSLAGPSMTSPTPGSTIAGGSATFTWTDGGTLVTHWWLYVGTYFGGANLHDSGNLGPVFSTSVSGLPINGSTVYVRLWYRTGGNWFSLDYTYGTSSTPTITSPTPGSTLSSSTLSLTWSANGLPIDNFSINAAYSAGGNGLCDSGILASSTLSHDCTGLPGTNLPLHVRFWYKPTGGNWAYIDYTYTLTSPSITSPTPGSTMTGSSASFTWAANGTTVTNYQLWIYRGTKFYYDSDELPDTTLSVLATGLPTNDGGPLTARLWFKTSYSTGIPAAWYYREFSYTAQSTAPSMFSPTPGSTLTGTSVDFEWLQNGHPTEHYWLYVGTFAGGSNLHNSGDLGTALTRSVTGLPSNGSTVYVRLWYRNGSGGTAPWVYLDYTYTSYLGVFGTPAMDTPTPGSTLSGSSVTFTWITNSHPSEHYWLYVGTFFGGSNLHNSGDLGTATSRLVTGLPTNGSTAYVRLWYRDGAGPIAPWVALDYTYTTGP